MSGEDGSLEEAEAILMNAITLARQQGALSWELRISVSLASVYARQNKSEVGRDMLRSVLERFTEGFDTHDLIEARALIESLTSSRV